MATGSACYSFIGIWHTPWPQTPVQLEIQDDALLKSKWPWLRDARFRGANYSPGLRKIWMGRPHRIGGRAAVLDPHSMTPRLRSATVGFNRE